jgi:PAT family beta-lactamase induction signal transducer AmpG
MSLFGSVYFVEGALLCFFSGFNTLYLRSFDLSYTQIGVMSAIALLPMIIKIFIGLMSDKVSLFGLGFRKPYIVIGLFLQALSFFLLPLVNPARSYVLYVVLMFMAALGMSSYDTTTDGFSIDSTPDEERGIVQGIMVAGRALSMIVFALAFGFFSARGEWKYCFILVGALTLLVIPLALSVKETRVNLERAEAVDKSVLKQFASGAVILYVILGMVYPLALYSAEGNIGPYLKEHFSVPLDSVGRYVAIFGVGSIVGAVGGGWLSKKIGRRASLYSAIVATAAATLVLALLPSVQLVGVITLVFGVCFGYYETVYFALGMDLADPRNAAFMFSIFMAVGNLGIALGGPLSGIVIDRYGFAAVFLMYAAIHVVTLPLAFGVFRLRKDLLK